MKNWRLGTCQNNSHRCISKVSKDSDLNAFENCQPQPMYFINRSSMVTLKHSPRRRWQKQRGVIGQALPKRKAVRKKKAQRQVGERYTVQIRQTPEAKVYQSELSLFSCLQGWDRGLSLWQEARGPVLGQNACLWPVHVRKANYVWFSRVLRCEPLSIVGCGVNLTARLRRRKEMTALSATWTIHLDF